MVNGKGTNRPYVNFLGNSTTDVTGSMHLVRYQKYCILLDCGMIQGGDIVTGYKTNREQLKKIKPNEIDYVILSHNHIDHSGLIPALFAKGCHAHVYIPQGSLPFLKLLWEDSQKIMESDCLKIQKKHGIKAPPLYTQENINQALDRCIEIPFNSVQQVMNNIRFTYYSAGHIVCSAQIYLELGKDPNEIKRIGYTGDIGGPRQRVFTDVRESLPFVDLLIGENTYNSPARPNSIKDRANDILKIQTIIGQANKILIPSFSLQRTQEIITVLYNNGIMTKCPVYLDSPLAEKFCNIWPDIDGWPGPMKDVKIIHDYEQSISLQKSNEHCIIISASGFMQGGRIVSHLKTALSNPHNHIIFIGYAGENNLASQIKSGQKEVNVDGLLVSNKANITELRSFSSHASYEELMEYYAYECRYNKLALVHGNFEDKTEFSVNLQENLVSQGKSSRVICTNQDQKIFF